MRYVRSINSRWREHSFIACSVQYPKICREEVSIHVIQSRSHILNTVGRTPIPLMSSSTNQPHTACSTLKLSRTTRKLVISLYLDRIEFDNHFVPRKSSGEMG
jgi:hypothetical protein